MLHTTKSSVLASLGNLQQSHPTTSVRAFPKKKRRILSVPGLTGPVLLVGSPRARAVPGRATWRDVLSLTADILDLRSWRDLDPLAGFMLAAFVAVVAQPLVYGSLGTSIVALMTPVK
jgi:hypothetical protein